MVSFLLERGANPLSEHDILRIMSPLSLVVEAILQKQNICWELLKTDIPLQNWRYQAEQETVKKREPKAKQLLEYYYWRGSYPLPNLRVKGVKDVETAVDTWQEPRDIIFGQGNW